MTSNNCPLCGKTFSDFLKHIRFTHKIRDADQFSEEVEKLEKKTQKQKEFAKYVADLQFKKQNGEITTEKYRELITEWVSHNKI